MNCAHKNDPQVGRLWADGLHFLLTLARLLVASVLARRFIVCRSCYLANSHNPLVFVALLLFNSSLSFDLDFIPIY